jgi:hypothetical protein
MRAILMIGVALAAGCGPSERQMGANEANARGSLKTLATAQADFRSNDRESNRVNDFWTGDVAGLYAIAAGGGEIRLIEQSIALADHAPLEGGLPYYPKAISSFGTRAPKAGYWYAAMKRDGVSGDAYARDTDGSGHKVHHAFRFGFCAFPAEYGKTGRATIIISEDNTLYERDTAGKPQLEWPADAELSRDWKKLD